MEEDTQSTENTVNGSLGLQSLAKQLQEPFESRLAVARQQPSDATFLHLRALPAAEIRVRFASSHHLSESSPYRRPLSSEPHA